MGGGNAQKSAKARAEAQKKAAENKVLPRVFAFELSEWSFFHLQFGIYVYKP